MTRRALDAAAPTCSHSCHFFFFGSWQALGEPSKKEKKEVKERRKELLVTLSFANSSLQQLRK
jgi:hypothetical protein